MRFGRLARVGRRRSPGSESHERLAVQAEVTRALTGAASAGEAAALVLERAGRGLGWDLGVMWRIDPQTQDLVCRVLWQPPQEPLHVLAASIRSCGCRIGK